MNWIDRKVEDYGLSSAYDQYIMADWRTCLWNPTRYLNIWLTKISTRSSEFPTVLGGYYGFLEANCNDYVYLNPDGDNAYCPDTYNYYYAFYPSVFKANNLDSQPEDEPTRPME